MIKTVIANFDQTIIFVFIHIIATSKFWVLYKMQRTSRDMAKARYVHTYSISLKSAVCKVLNRRQIYIIFFKRYLDSRSLKIHICLSINSKEKIFRSYHISIIWSSVDHISGSYFNFVYIIHNFVAAVTRINTKIMILMKSAL